MSLPCYTISDLLWNKSYEWVNEVEKRILKVKYEDMKLITLMQRIDTKELSKFNIDFKEQEQPPMLSAVELMNLQKRK